MAKFCKYCGTPLREGASFCRSCGAQIGKPAQRSARPAPRQAVPQPAQPQAPQPVYPQQQQYQPQPAKKKRSGFRTAIALLLVVAILAGIAVTGFWYPGFFRGGGGGDGSGASLSYDGTLPGPEDGVFDYSDEEIASAPAVSMAVSPDRTVAASDGITVDFGPCNLDSADTFTIRTLPLHEDEAGGYRYRGYDLSLDSGTDRFPTEVQVRIPREADDSDLVYFVSQNPVTGENEAEYFEISEDGKEYILYTTHFSLHEKMVINDVGTALSEAIRAGDVSNQMTRDALSAFFYTALNSPDNVMLGTVWYNPQDLWAKMMDKYAYLPASNSLLGAMAHQMESGGAQAVDFSRTLLNGAKDIYTAVDVGNNAKTAADGGAEFALRNLSLESISPGLKENVQKYSNWNTAHGLALARFSAISTAIGVLFLNDKISKEAADGKFATGEQVVKEHWTDYLGVVLGTVSTAAAYVGVAAAAGTAAAAAAPYVAAGCAVGGLALYFYGASQKSPYDELSTAERNYRDFSMLTKTGSVYRTFFYDYEDPKSPEFEADSGISQTSYAVIEKLQTLTPKQHEQFKQLVNTEMEKLNGSGGFHGFDPRTGVTNDFKWTCAYLFTVMEDTPEKIGPAFTEFYQKYADACFYNLSDAEYLSFCRAAMAHRGEDAAAASLPWTNSTEKETIRKTYTERLVKEMFAETSDLFLYFSVMAQHKAQLVVDEQIRSEILPLLNTGVEITVEDKSLDDPKDFSKSIYCSEPRRTDIDTQYTAPDGSVYADNFKYQYEYPLSFWTKSGGSYARVDGPVFLPSELVGGTVNNSTGKYQTLLLHTCSYGKFYPAEDNFVPDLVDGTSNVIFRCSYFNYLLMGAPTVLGYKDVSTKNSEIKYADFTVDPAKAVREGNLDVIRVNITLDGKKQETQSCSLYVESDSSMDFERGRNTGANMPADCKLTLQPDGTFTLEIAAASSDRYSKPCTRESFTITGKIIAENASAETCLHRKGYIHTISASSITATRDGKEYRFDNFSAYLSNDKDGKNGFDQGFSYVDIMVNPLTGELRDVEIAIHADRTSTYYDGKPEFIEKSGIAVWLKPEIVSEGPSG